MMQVSTIGLDLAKTVFQVHGVDASGAVTVRRALRRAPVLAWFAKLPPCLVGMEACATARYWARELTRVGHDVRLIPPAYTKAYVRRNKNDAADAAAICEAVSRPAMRFVAVKSEAQQAAAGLHKLRAAGQAADQVINQLCGLMAEFGIVAAKGPGHVGELAAVLADPAAARIPAPLADALAPMAELWRDLEQRIAALDRQIRDWGRGPATFRHLLTIPGFGPILASAMAAIVVDPGAFRSGRDFAAALGLVPRHASPGSQGRPSWSARSGKPAASSSSVRSASAAMAISAGCWSTARWRSSSAGPAGPVARPAARQEAAQAGRLRARQQDGADRVSANDPPGGLPVSAAGGLSGGARSARRACEGEVA